MITTEDRITTETKLKRIAWLSSRNKHKEFKQLIPEPVLNQTDEFQGCSLRSVGCTLRTAEIRKNRLNHLI